MIKQLSSDPFSQTRIARCKAEMALCDNLVNPYTVINELGYEMVYDDVGCCQNGHRMNILDKHHTHVSIGVAYDKFYLALVQNFEDKYTIWKIPISYDSISNTVYMNGRLTRNASTFGGIAIRYDPLPSQETYKQNKDRESYSEGQIVAIVVPHHFAPLTRDIRNDSNNYQLITANKSVISCDRNNKDNNTVTSFDISFPMSELTKKYGSGVYTVDTWYKDTSYNRFQASSVSLFVH